ADVQANEEVVRLTAQGLDAARKLERAGAGGRPDVLRARADLEQAEARLAVARRRLEAAGRVLAAVVGLPGPPAAGSAPGPLGRGDLDGPTPALEWGPLLEGVLTRSSEVQEAQALVLQAEGLLRRAEVEVVPNVTLAARPFYSHPDKNAQAFAGVTAAVPVF